MVSQQVGCFSIAQMCVHASASPDSATTLTRQPVNESTMLEFIAQVEALPDDVIPPACRADLLAVAAALQSRY